MKKEFVEITEGFDTKKYIKTCWRLDMRVLYNKTVLAKSL